MGGEIVPIRKKFPQPVSQKLLILLTLPRQAAAEVPLQPRHCASFVPFLCRISARRPKRRAVHCRMPLDYVIKQEISSKGETNDEEINSKLKVQREGKSRAGIARHIPSW
jgi:hypothetical protein